MSRKTTTFTTKAPPDTTGGAHLSHSTLTSNDAIPLTPNVAQQRGTGPRSKVPGPYALFGYAAAR
jgi:hypothetical protein